MTWTNLHNLPSPLVSAILNDPYRPVGDISVTGLIRPPRMRVLEKRHRDKIAEDVSDHIWRLLGQSIHSVLERADTFNQLSEERLVTNLFGWTISGQPDLLDHNHILSDYKVTSVYSFLLGDKPEWEQQLNLYAWLYRKHGFEAKGAQIVAILRDWVRSRAMREPDYPQAGALVQPIPLWSPEKQAGFALDRVERHQRAEALPDDKLPMCTPEERWEKPATWAVKKKGGKRAKAVCSSYEEAGELLQGVRNMGGKIGEYIIEHRPGASVRCQTYCSVARFCSFGKTLIKQEEDAE